MECMQLRSPPGPFHYLISEQAKSLVALQVIYIVIKYISVLYICVNILKLLLLFYFLFITIYLVVYKSCTTDFKTFSNISVILVLTT